MNGTVNQRIVVLAAEHTGSPSPCIGPDASSKTRPFGGDGMTGSGDPVDEVGSYNNSNNLGHRQPTYIRFAGSTLPSCPT